VISAVPSTGGRQAELVSVSCPAVADCYAAGFSFLGIGPSYPPSSPVPSDRPVIEHFNGATWSMMSVPSTPGVLSSITCVSRRDCLAVGGTRLIGHTNGTTLVEAFNGTGWSVVPSPNLSSAAFAGTPAAGAPPGQILNVLDGVACRQQTECFAVGIASVALDGDSIVTEPITLRFDGTAWAATTIVSPLAEFSDVACDTEACLAVGRTSNNLQTEAPFASTLSGTAWTRTAVPSGSFATHGVTCAAATCLALAYSGYAEIYSDGTWISQSLPFGPAPATMWYDLTCVSATECVTVGEDNSSEGRTGLDPLAWDRSLVATRTNGSWSIEPSPNHADMDNTLFAVACPSWKKCVAVGYAEVPNGDSDGPVSPLALSQG
jgi:hypothetical protein